MSFRTPLSQARGLGSAKHGVGHWVAERVAGIALVPLVLWAVYSGLHLAQLDYYGAVEWVSSPVNATLVILLIAVAFQHMHGGMRVIIEDYVYSHFNKVAALLGSLFLTGLAGALAIMSILKVALGGA